MRANWLECASMRLRTKQMNTKPAETKERLSWQVLPRSLRPFGPLEFNLKNSKWWLYFACVTFVPKYFCSHTQRRQHRRFRSFATTWLRPTHKFFSRLDKSYLGAESCNQQFRLNRRYLFRKLRCQLVSATISPAINSSLLQTKRLNDTNLMFPFIKFFFHVCSTWTKNITSSHRKRPCQHNEFAT